ncbi:diphthamide synthesis protein [Candidatus Woesearchaeota archaeon]|nr:diphthamide synthesis protein [Candidatus Woesearchaeota archaeon]
MRVLFLEAPYNYKAELSHEALTYIISKGYKTMGVYAAVQFLGSLEKVKKQLNDVEIKMVTSSPERSQYKGQLLGCDVFTGNLKLHDDVDSYLYIGDGKFHPLALLHGQRDLVKEDIKEIICYDPLHGKINVLKIEEVMGTFKRYRATLIKFLSAKKIGVIITLKPGQEFMKMALRLEKKFTDKKFYFFVDDTVSLNQLENFNFIDMWVNTACPRIAIDDAEWFSRGVINLNDAYSVKEILEKKSVLNEV